MSYTTFGTWGRGDEGDKILKCYTFDLFTFSITQQKVQHTFTVRKTYVKRTLENVR